MINPRQIFGRLDRFSCPFVSPLGAGRIGQVHDRSFASSNRAILAAFYDPVERNSDFRLDQYGVEVRNIAQIVNSDDIDAVILCTPIDLHALEIEMFANAGKSVFCEKPIDLDLERVRGCGKVVNETEVTLMFGFNRRSDLHFMSLRNTIEKGHFGKSEQVIITSRDTSARRTRCADQVEF